MKKILFILMAAALMLSGCGMQDMNRSGSAYVEFSPSDPSARTLTQEALDNTTRAILGFVSDDAFYNFREMKDITNFTGRGILFTGIPVGDYTFLASLLNDDKRILAMGLARVSIKAGMNDLEVNMGPGFKFEVSVPPPLPPGISFGDPLSLNLDDLSDEVDISFNGTIMEVNLPSVFTQLAELPAGVGQFILTIQTFNNVEVVVTKTDSTNFSTSDLVLASTSGSGDGSNLENSTLTFKNLKNQEVKKFDLTLIERDSFGKVVSEAVYHIHLNY